MGVRWFWSEFQGAEFWGESAAGQAKLVTNLRQDNSEGLTTDKAGLKYREIPAKASPRLSSFGNFRIYDLQAARNHSKP
jgi:hypothetical protein